MTKKYLAPVILHIPIPTVRRTIVIILLRVVKIYNHRQLLLTPLNAIPKRMPFLFQMHKIRLARADKLGVCENLIIDLHLLCQYIIYLYFFINMIMDFVNKVAMKSCNL